MKIETSSNGLRGGHGTIPTARLRILETTDLHMQLLDYDYFADHTDSNTGLIQLSDTITRLRSEPGHTSLLFDNGDFIQGNPLADHIAANGTNGQVHPMIAAFNTLKYDAVTLGNHEFNYGLGFLRAALADAQFPVTCANITLRQGEPLAQPYLILDREMTCDDGAVRKLRVGVIGFVTPQITMWDKAALHDSVDAQDIVDSARDMVPQIKTAGADVIIALCHSGIGSAEHTMHMENAAVPLAAVDGIDVVLTGHTHEVFPGDHQAQTNIIDPAAGTLHGKPAVMAGFYGNWLGVVDLQLGWTNGTWHIQQHSTRLEHGTQSGQPGPLQDQLTAHLQAAHKATLDHIRQPIARTDVAIHSFFANIAPDLSQQLLAGAQQDFIQQALQDTDHDALPVLSATSPFRAGGRAGPGHYIDIAPGDLTLRDVAAIYPFNNTLCAVRRSGRQLRCWLERAASHYALITPGRQDQPLIDAHSPGYNSDTIFGLTYELDLSQPAKCMPDGTRLNSDHQRVFDLRYQGVVVGDDDVFVVAANSYRTNGGGGFDGTPDADVLYTSKQTARDVLIDYLRNASDIDPHVSCPRRFKHVPGTSATFQSAPAAQNHLPDGITHMGSGQDGFDLFRITF